ncbi:MAG: YbjQ family protein, partial [Planctomycetota bacterium]|jgi:uncharacterized protein YbjQ (UPF0145 family)
MGQLIVVLFLLVLGFSVGSWRERKHFKSLRLRESQYADVIIRNIKEVPDTQSVTGATLVSGDAVIASDYFKSFAARLRNIVGGEMKTYETLIVRARREATLRMLAQAKAAGANEVWNVRFETSNIRNASGRQSLGTSVEVFAFGTAVIRS